MAFAYPLRDLPGRLKGRAGKEERVHYPVSIAKDIGTITCSRGLNED
jgi:hypothetical protein